MKGILDIIQDIRNLERVPCNIGTIEYIEEIGGIKIEKIIIHELGHSKEAEKAMYYEYSPHCVMMYKKQYDKLFAPLFESIRKLNHTVAELQKELGVDLTENIKKQNEELD